jgi:hypothetical protein
MSWGIWHDAMNKAESSGSSFVARRLLPVKPIVLALDVALVRKELVPFAPGLSTKATRPDRPDPSNWLLLICAAPDERSRKRRGLDTPLRRA